MWHCPSCTLLNESKLLHCTLCSTPRPSPLSQPMTNSNETHQNEQQQQHQLDSPNMTTQQNPKPRKRKSWTKVSVQFEYSDDHQTQRKHTGNGYGNNGYNESVSSSISKTSSINEMANYGFGAHEFEDYNFDQYNDMESIIASNTISHSSTKNLKQLTRHSIYKNTYDAAGDTKFKSVKSSKTKSPITASTATSTATMYNKPKRKTRRKYNKYSITDIFASNSSFILDHEYNEDDICNLILNNSTQTQTKLTFLKSIWPHILRVTTRVLTGSKFRCPICLDEHISIGRITECGHCFCGMCLLHHLFSYQNSTKNEKDQQIVPEVKDDDNYNFTDLFGHCPLCHEYVSFEQCRPLTVIRCKDYKVNDSIDMVLIERYKGEQPVFSSNYRHNLNISTFRKFETEKYEIIKCEEEIIEINKLIKSSDPIYEEPFLRLVLIQVQQYKQYIIQQREEYHIKPISTSPILQNNDNHINTDLNEYKSIENSTKNKPIIVQPQQYQYQYQHHHQQQQQHRYRKKKYVYQSSDGQLIFLHPHNYNMLKHDKNYNFDSFPSVLSNCKILQIENYEQSYDLRRKYPFLGFIPVDVRFSFIEVDLSSIVSKSTLKYFEKQSIERKQFRMEQEKLMEEETKYKQIMEEQRIALQKQKYARPQVDINDYLEFPSLSTPSKSINNTDNDGHSNSDNNSDSNGNGNGNGNETAINNMNRKSPAQRSWSQITVKSNSSPQLVAANNNNNNNNNMNNNGSNKKKRRRGRNKKKNKNKT